MKINNSFLRAANVPIENSTFAGSFNSDPVKLTHSYMYAIMLVYSGGATGTVKLQASCDPPVDRAGSPTNWVDIGGSTVDLAVGSPIFYNITDAAYTWVRLVYTRTAGSLVLTAPYIVKGW